jgi:hypothetical protein
VITREAATPGYVPGELEPGPWHVVLGLHRIPPAGMPYEVRVSLGPAAVPPAPDPPPTSSGTSVGGAAPTPGGPARRNLPAEPGLRWLACDFHAHTVHSDGTLTVAELAARAASRGLDVLAVTDHNTISHHASLAELSARYGVLLVPGQEITTDTGHANAFGPIGWVDFREPVSAWLSHVSGAGGVLSINHPLAADCGWLHPLSPPSPLAPLSSQSPRPPLAEVWHCTWLDPAGTDPCRGGAPPASTSSRSAAATSTSPTSTPSSAAPSPGSPSPRPRRRSPGRTPAAGYRPKTTRARSPPR